MPMGRLTPSSSMEEEDFNEAEKLEDSTDLQCKRDSYQLWGTFHWWGAGPFPDNDVEFMYKECCEKQAAHRVNQMRSYLLPLVVLNGAILYWRQVLEVSRASQTRQLLLLWRLLLYSAITFTSSIALKDKRYRVRPSLRFLYCAIVCGNVFDTALSPGDNDAEASSLFVNVICDVLAGVSICSNVEEPLYATWLAALIHPTLSLAGVHTWRDGEFIPPILVSVIAFVVLTRIYSARRRDFLQSLLHRGVLPACLPACTRSMSWPSTASSEEHNALGAEVPKSWSLVHDSYYSTEDAESLASMVQVEEEGMRWKEEWGERIADFEPWEAIGTGGFGRVYAGVERRSQQQVAMKNLGGGERARRELRFTLKLSHPNVVAYRGHFQGEGGTLRLLLEYCKGGSLDELLRRAGPITEPAARVLIGDLLGGLGYLHRHGMAHRDVKPGNLLITEEGVLKLADMGSVQYVSECPPRHRITILYSAPEALREDCNPRLADIWSVGCSAVEALSLQIPHFGRVPVASSEYLTFVQKCTSPPTLPSSLSPMAASFAKACVQVEPERRVRVHALQQHPFVLDRRLCPLSAHWLHARAGRPQDPAARSHGRSQTQTLSVENRRTRSEDWTMGSVTNSWPTRLWALLGGVVPSSSLDSVPYNPQSEPRLPRLYRSY